MRETDYPPTMSSRNIPTDSVHNYAMDLFLLTQEFKSTSKEKSLVRQYKRELPDNTIAAVTLGPLQYQFIIYTRAGQVLEMVKSLPVYAQELCKQIIRFLNRADPEPIQ